MFINPNTLNALLPGVQATTAAEDTATSFLWAIVALVCFVAVALWVAEELEKNG
jgi:hypothetical protein